MSRSDKTKDIGIAADRAANENIGSGDIHSETECCVGNTCCWSDPTDRSVEEKGS